MGDIILELIAGLDKILSAEGIIDEKGRVVYTSKSEQFIEGHKQLNLNDIYLQLTDFAKKNKYKDCHIHIKIHNK